LLFKVGTWWLFFGIVEIWNSLLESAIQAKTVKQFEIGLDEHWKHQECKYDYTANINIRSNSGSDLLPLLAQTYPLLLEDHKYHLLFLILQSYLLAYFYTSEWAS
jgi:hypothetical protein